MRAEWEAPPIEGLVLREALPADEPFLRDLYHDVRLPELAPTGWDEATKRAFTDSQFTLQDRYYRANYPGARFLLIEEGGAKVGRLYVHAREGELRVMEVSIVPGRRNAGLGTRILAALQQAASREGRALALSVETFNPVRRLYARLGFVERTSDGIYLELRWSPPSPG